jgi:tetratricopeptide (TPR) repeat protein
MDFQKTFLIAENAHRAGDFLTAEQHYKKIIKNINDINAIYGLATLYMQTKKFKQAIILFKQALKLEPNAADIIYNFSLCLHYNQESEKAIELIKQSKKLLINTEHLSLEFAKLSLHFQEPLLAINILQPHSLHTIECKLILAEAYTQLESWHKALCLWQEISLNEKKPNFVWQKMALCSAKLRQYSLAISAFGKYMTVCPKQSDNYVKYADLFLLNKDISQAKKQLDIAITLGDNSLYRFEIEAKIKRLQHNVNDAVSAAKNALEISPNSSVAWQILHEFNQLSAQDIANLKNIILTTRESSFDTIQNTYTLAKTYQQNKDYKQAFNFFKQANQMQHQRIIKNNENYDNEQQKIFYQWLKTHALQKKTSNNSSLQAIFIVGMPRSGTTLVERLLDQHPKTKSSGENEALTFSLANLYTQQQSQKAFNFTQYYQQNAEHLASNYYQFTNIKNAIIIDKMPHNFIYVSAIIAIFPEAKIIQMRRNPVDLALSIYSQHFNDSHNYACQLSDIANAIFNANQLMNFWQKKYSDNIIDINYQQLVSEPEKTAQDIFKFCNLDWQQQFLNFYKKNNASFTFSELQVRKPINTNKVNYWKNYQQEMQPFITKYKTLR